MNKTIKISREYTVNYSETSDVERLEREILFSEEYKDVFGNVIIDIGANLGMFSLYAYDKASKIYAIEPSVMNFNHLKKNKEDNNLSKLEVFNYAIGGSNRKGLLKNTGSALGYALTEDTNVETEEVTVKTLDTFMKENKITHADIVKIDTEGAEHEILEDITFPKEKIDMMIIETHGSSVEDAVRFLGYTFIRAQTTASIYVCRRIHG